MRKSRKISSVLLIALALSAVSIQANAMVPFWGWETSSDGTSYVDSDGCIHQVTTETKYVFWIKVKTLTNDQKVANC